MEYRLRQPDFERGTASDAYRFMGCQLCDEGAVFRVWAPAASAVSVVGDFNKWDKTAHPMRRISSAGVWEADIAGIKKFSNYKFCIFSGGREIFKADPYAFHSETHDSTASKAYPLDGYRWNDGDYIASRDKKNIYRSPVNIYEAHIGSWRRYSDGNVFDYRKFADEAIPYLTDMHYTHIELIGIAEYPFDGSWGYQVTGYYAPTSRYGTPDDFKYMVDRFHSAGIGVILDWVPGHFPKNENGLYEFDGGPLYEPADELRKEHKEWGTRCFDYRRGEVRSFLISNAVMWFDIYHIDGLRVDAVASMLYLDYGRKEWRPNCYGGKENLDAVDFLRALNTVVFAKFPSAMMIAEESTAWPGVTQPADKGGLGFNFKWNMGWMNDSLRYIRTDPLFRSGVHNCLTFSLTYAFSENYILPISHDEVVHGKGSLLNKMPGAYEEKFASYRAFLMNMYIHPGKKLLFMGCELAMFAEWAFDRELDWQLLAFPAHAAAHEFVRALNNLYTTRPEFYERDDGWNGFKWHIADDSSQNIVAMERYAADGSRLMAVINFSPVARACYRIGADPGVYTEILRSDIDGWDAGGDRHRTVSVPSHGFEASVVLDIRPYGAVYMTAAPVKRQSKTRARRKIARKASDIREKGEL